jgi:DNA repair exonuclease SbcCD nuclease subunit
MPGTPGGISQNDIAALQEHVNYLALGHWHKPFEREGWIYNPGSLEACSMDERHWPGGLFHVSIDTKQAPKHIVRHVESPRRPFHRSVFRVDGYETSEAIYDGLSAQLKAEAHKVRAGNLAPVVEVSLEGILAFERNALDTEYLETLAKEAFSPLIVRVKNNKPG